VITAKLSAEVSMKNKSNYSVNKSRNKTVTNNSNKVRTGIFAESVKPVGHTQGSTGKPVGAGTRSTSGGTSRRRAHQVQRFRAGRARKNKSQESCGTSLGQSSGIQITISELETVLTVKLTLEPLTFCGKPETNSINKRSKPNSQRHQKSKNWNKAKPSGANKDKTKGYTRPQAEKFLDKKQATYKPWTESQKERFAQLIEESLLV
jgi:hypothetical protein